VAALPSLDIIIIVPLEVLLEKPNPFPSETLQKQHNTDTNYGIPG
jgi:hypothetical protein